MDMLKKYMYMYIDYWRLFIIYLLLNKGMNEWEIKKMDGIEGLLLFLDDIWVLFILFFIIFFVCICGFLCYLIYFDFFFFDRYNLVFIFIIYILRKIKWLVVGVLKKNKMNFML